MLVILYVIKNAFFLFFNLASKKWINKYTVPVTELDFLHQISWYRIHVAEL